jgi:hypothetical protein
LMNFIIIFCLSAGSGAPAASNGTTGNTNSGGSGNSYDPPSYQNHTIPLCEEDAAAIYDLHVAYQNSLIVNESDRRGPSRDQANFSDLVNIAELSVRRVIEMAKQVQAFRALPQVSVCCSRFVFVGDDRK